MLVYINFEKLFQGRAGYDFQGYGELCNFMYCLLLKTKDIAAFTGLMDWEEYMAVPKIIALPNASMDTFLMNCDYGKILAGGKASEVKDFRGLFRDFINRLAVLIVESMCVKPGVSRCLYSFCSEIILD